LHIRSRHILVSRRELSSYSAWFETWA
jgi:hypothetical protein